MYDENGLSLSFLYFAWRARKVSCRSDDEGSLDGPELRLEKSELFCDIYVFDCKFVGMYITGLPTYTQQPQQSKLS